MQKLTPKTHFDLDLLQLVAALLFVGGAGYSVGHVHAQLERHEALPGHAEVVRQAQSNAETLARVAAVLEVLERLETRERKH